MECAAAGSEFGDGLAQIGLRQGFVVLALHDHVGAMRIPARQIDPMPFLTERSVAAEPDAAQAEDTLDKIQHELLETVPADV